MTSKVESIRFTNKIIDSIIVMALNLRLLLNLQFELIVP